MGLAPRVWLFPDYNQAESRVVAWYGPVLLLKKWYQESVDVHLKVTRLIAKVIQQNKLAMPVNPDTGKMLFHGKDHGECGSNCLPKCSIHFVKGDEEREIAKRGVHAGNYGEGAERFGLRTGLPTSDAEKFKKIYETLFPEIKTKYQAKIEAQIRKNRTIWTPEPVPYRKIFYGLVDDNLMRQAYASYPQIVVSQMLNRTLAHCARVFLEDKDEKLKDQWCAWYGQENWDSWRHLRDNNVRSPKAILWSGMDVRLNVHDAGGISVPNDNDLIAWTTTTWKTKAEERIMVDPNDPMVIPVDFKKGPTWGGDDLKDYKIVV